MVGLCVKGAGRLYFEVLLLRIRLELGYSLKFLLRKILQVFIRNEEIERVRKKLKISAVLLSKWHSKESLITNEECRGKAVCTRCTKLIKVLKTERDRFGEWYGSKVG